MIYRITVIIILGAMMSCQAQQSTSVSEKSNDKVKESVLSMEDLEFPEVITPVVKSKKEWKSQLSEMEYHVLREKGTERSFSGPYVNNKKAGVYTCGGCGLPLFDSKTKFKSGTGWPSYYEPIKKEYVKEDVDFKIGYKRVEILCARCDGHLGHVFTDGPKPTGLRYCMNGASLDFVERSE